MSAVCMLGSQRAMQSSLHRVSRPRPLRTIARPFAVSRSDLVAEVAEKTKMKKKEAEEAVTAMLDIIVDKVASGERVTLFGFGTFEAKKRESRQGRNPQTGAALTIPARTVPKFSPGRQFKLTVDGKDAKVAPAAAEKK